VIFVWGNTGIAGQQITGTITNQADNPTTNLGAATTDMTGVATVVIPNLPAGTYTLHFEWAGQSLNHTVTMPRPDGPGPGGPGLLAAAPQLRGATMYVNALRQFPNKAVAVTLTGAHGPPLVKSGVSDARGIASIVFDYENLRGHSYCVAAWNFLSTCGPTI
jgi:hypothetical protein